MKKNNSYILTFFLFLLGVALAYLFSLYASPTIPPNSIGLDTAKKNSEKPRDVVKRKTVAKQETILTNEFQHPSPAPSDYKLIFDPLDEPDDTVKSDLISSIVLEGGEEGTPEDARTAMSALAALNDATPAGENEVADEEDDAVVSGSQKDYFEPEALAELEQFGAEVDQGSGLIGGSGVDLADSLAAIRTPTPQERQDPEDDEDDEIVWFHGQTRGYAVLYLMQEQAQPAVERQLKILMDSHVRSVYLGVLADGTFGLNYSYLQSVLQRLTAAGHHVTLALYLSNGPAMRSEIERERYEGSINRFAPDEFRDRIQSDGDLRRQFASIVQQSKQTFEFNISLSQDNSNIAYVMLEDNLDYESYQAMREIAASILGGLVRFIRNPCPGCYEGNDSAGAGDGVEHHSPEFLSELGPADGYSMDGKGLYFPGEVYTNGLSVDETRLVIASTQNQGVPYFALWRAARQGIGSGERLPPDERNYEMPSNAQAAIEIDLLRYGLRTEDEETVSFEQPEEIFR